MGSVYIKTVAGGENTTLDGTEAVELDTGTESYWTSLITIRTLFKTTYDTLYQAANSVLTTLAGASANGQSLVTAANYAAMRALMGAAGVTLISTVPHKQLWIGNAKPTLTSGCAAAAQIEMGTNKNVYDYLAFDAASIEYAYANIALPQDYTGGTVYAQFWWTHPSTTTNFKVSWGLQAVSFSDDDILDAAQGTAIYSNDTGGTTSDLYVSPQTTAITIAGTPAAGDMCNFRISRKADDATNDTLAVDAYLLGVMVWYPVNA